MDMQEQRQDTGCAIYDANFYIEPCILK